MACNRETSADGATSSAPSGCQNPDALVPCCNSNCCFHGCAATMNLCSKCYSEHLLKEGALFTSKQRVDPCDPTMDTLVARSMVEGAGESHESLFTDDDATKTSEDAASLDRIAVDMSADMRQALGSKNTSSMCNNAANMSDVQAVLRRVDVSSIVVDTMADASDLCHQRIPSPLILSPVELAPQQIESGLSRPPLPRQQAVNRCLACRKRVGLLGFKCRCGNLFCASHRYSDKHDCSFDYKVAGRVTIAKENPVVIASKVVKI